MDQVLHGWPITRRKFWWRTSISGWPPIRGPCRGPERFLDRMADLYAFAATPRRRSMRSPRSLRPSIPKYAKTIKLPAVLLAQDRQKPLGPLLLRAQRKTRI